MRTVKVHPSKSIKFTKHAAHWCQILNQHKFNFPEHSFKEMAEHYGLSESNTRRYYYGMHHANLGYFGCGYSQVRMGACVAI